MQRYSPSTALVIVDVQNDFADPAGSLSVKGGDAVVPVINGEIDMARSAGATIVATQDWHPVSTPHFEKDGGIWPVHCVGGTWGAELHPELAFPDGARRVRHAGGVGTAGFSLGPQSDEATLRLSWFASPVVPIAPEARHASMPPARLRASRPNDRRVAAARALRAPLRQ